LTSTISRMSCCSPAIAVWVNQTTDRVALVSNHPDSLLPIVDRTDCRSWGQLKRNDHSLVH
jgi:hypothetical protein